MIKKENGFYLWKKGLDLPFPNTKYFETWEFDCSCNFSNCIEQKVSIELIEKLILIRETFGLPVRITSSFRCSLYQKQLRLSGNQTAVGISQHELGKAADIQPTKMNKENLDKLFELCKNEFRAIGDARHKIHPLTGKLRGFIHVDLRMDKERIWSY